MDNTNEKSNLQESLGSIGEQTACEYLLNLGYKVLERNYRRKWGEIDITSRAPDMTLVFVEVRTMIQKPNGLIPEDQMSSAKIKKFKRACSAYAEYNKNLIDEKRGWRLDVVAITYSPADFDKPISLKHYQNI